jgi:hypothetical protein
VVLVVSLAFASPVAAREPVDPSTLNPPPPDFFNAACERVGRGVICDLAFTDPDVIDEASGITCDGTELLVSQTRSVAGKRYYDQNGDLIRRHFRESVSGTFSNPDSTKSAPWVQRDTVVHKLGVPGDLGTGTERVTGLMSLVWLPGGGTLVDAGTIVRDVGTDEVLHISGKHPFDDYFRLGDAAALDPLCAALN